ncbi:MAG: hypothetical protein IKY12_06210, partial [Clostridia bacterium]|nr:hypothetical protein [Clostridia bacterium]
PMLESTKLYIDSVAVQLTEDGDYVIGKNLKWDITRNECSLKFDAATGTIKAYGTGYAYVTVSDGNNELEIVVSVAKTAEDKFNIFEYDFLNYDADVAAGKSPWKAQAFRKKTTGWVLDEKTVSWNSSKGGVALAGGGSSSILYLADDSVIKNFKNYTINFTGAASSVGSWCLIGALAGLGLDAETNLATGDSKFVAATVENNSGVGNVLFRTTDYKYRRDAVDIDFTYAANTMYDYSYEFKDDDVIMSAAVAGGELTQQYKLSEDTIKPELPSTGTVGLYVENMTGYFSKFSVSVDVDTLPELTALPPVYKISAVSPALPIVVKNKVNTADVAVQLIAGGEYVSGSELSWKVVSNTKDIVYEAPTGDIYAFETGKYLMEVTDGTNTATVAVIVDETANSNFYLLDYDFSDMAADANNAEGKWIVQSVYNKTEFQEKGTGSMGTLNLTYNATYDGVYFNTNGNYDILYYADDTILKLFTDYTVGVTATLTRDMANWRRFGIVGRIALGTEGLIDADSTYIAANINTNPNGNNMNFVIKGNTYLNGNKYFQDFQIDEPFTMQKNVTYDLAATYQGKDLIFYAGQTGSELQKLYTLSLDTQANLATNVANKMPTTPGTIGFYGGDAETYISRAYVSANITTLPDMSPIVAIEATDNTVYATVNHYMDLADVSFNMGAGTVSGDKLGWATIRTPNFEINAETKEFAAYQKGEFTQTIIYNGQEHTITFVITDDETVEKPRETPLVNITGDAAVNIKPTDGADTEYTLTIMPGDNKKLKVNSLKNGKTVLTENFDSTGRVYGFLADTPSEIYITAEYIEDNGQYNSAMLGATLNYEKSGIRFGARTDMVRKPHDANIGYLEDKVLVDGKVYTPTEIGMLLIPS